MFITAYQKSKHDAKVIADLDRHIHSLARVLEPFSKMDGSEILPDLNTDIQALLEYVFITTSCGHLLIVFVANCLSSLRNGRRERLGAAFSIKAKVEMKCMHWQRASSALWTNFRFVSAELIFGDKLIGLCPDQKICETRARVRSPRQDLLFLF